MYIQQIAERYTMAIAKIPERKDKAATDKRAAEFIAQSGQQGAAEEANENRKPIMVRFPPDLLKRVDQAAKRLGISRSAFIVQSTAEKMDSQ
jgi:predicted HicB family RNase H-like nuclease